MDHAAGLPSFERRKDRDRVDPLFIRRRRRPDRAGQGTTRRSPIRHGRKRIRVVARRDGRGPSASCSPASLLEMLVRRVGSARLERTVKQQQRTPPLLVAGRTSELLLASPDCASEGLDAGARTRPAANRSRSSSAHHRWLWLPVPRSSFLPAASPDRASLRGTSSGTSSPI